MRVEEFGFGFPPRLFGIRRGEVLYSFNFLPVGGFVRIFGEDGSHRNNARSFASKKKWQRGLVIIAGVSMNFLFAFILFSVIAAFGSPQDLSDDVTPAGVKNIEILVTSIADGSPAQKAGLTSRDQIVTIMAGSEYHEVATIGGVQDFIAAHSGGEIVFDILRDGSELRVPVFARSAPPPGEGATGIILVRIGEVASPWYVAPWDGARTTVAVGVATVEAFGAALAKVILSGEVPQDLAGPVGIVSIAGQVRELGFVFFLQLVALISLNLGIINILPFPALDGGRLVFIIAEAIKGSPVNKRVEGAVHTVGFAILILLIILITLHDVDRFL